MSWALQLWAAARDTDFAGGDLAAIGAETFADCIAACDANEECVDVSYGRTTTCWLKGQITTANPAEGIWTAPQEDPLRGLQTPSGKWRSDLIGITPRGRNNTRAKHLVSG